MKGTTKKSAGPLFISAVAILLFAGLLSLQSNRRLIRSFDWVTDSYGTLQTLQYIQTMQEYAEAGVRAYVITGDVKRIEPFRTGQTMISYKLDEIAPHFAANPQEKEKFESLVELMGKHLVYLGKVVDQRREDGFSAAAQTVLVEDEASHRYKMEQLLSELEQSERRILEQRWDSTLVGTLHTKIALTAGTILSLLLIAGAYLLLRRENAERQIAQQERERAQAFLHSIIEHIPYAIIVKEAENLRLTLVNKAAESWFKQDREQLLGANAFDLKGLENGKAVMETDREILKGGQIVDIPEEIVGATDESARIAHTQKIPILDEDGVSQFLMCISEDITERQKADKMLRLAHDTALETARFKSEFISNMSHEIRTPIAIMTGMTALLLETELSAQQKKFATAVHRAGENLSAIAKTLLDFSKIEAGKFTLETTGVDVRQISESVVDMLKEQAQGKGIGLACLIAPEVPASVRGDAARLRQILTQIIGNAVKFTREGEVIVRASVAKQNENQCWIQFKVIDTGMGIPEDKQKLIFDAFRQADGSHTRRYGGTGMGLTIAKRTVELMGGEISLESRAEGGSTFSWTLPFSKKETDAPSVRVAQLPWTSARVLIVDENTVHRELMRRHLNTWSLASEAVSSGEAALDLIRRESRSGRNFQICIVDIHLPDMDAVQFARTLKKEPAYQGMRLIAMASGAAPEADVLQSLGFARCLRKPVDPAELHNGLMAAVQPHDQRAA